MIGLVASRADDASVAIASALRSLVAWESHEDADRSDADGGGTYHRRGDFELREFADWHLELSGVADAFSAPPRFVVFLSRHAGETGPLLTAHFTGNFGPAEYGGEPGDLARACPNVQRAVLESFDRHAPDGYDVGIECTHHGPTDVGAPSLFVELGSSESAWTDPAGARAVARAVLDLDGLRPDAADGGGGGDEPEGAVTDETVADGDRNRLAGPGRTRQIVGFGGGHYAPRFERILRETDWRVGHVAADWSLQAMGGPDANREVIERAFAQSAATRAVVAGDNPELEAVVDDLGYRVVDETWLRETTGVDLDLVAAAERALVPVDEGLRFGAPARDVASDALGPVAAKSESGVAEPAAPDGFDVVSLPEDLLAEAAGIDEAATMDAVRAHVTAFETVEGGTKPRGRALVASGAGSPLESVVDDLAAVLREKYDAVEREDDRIVATREAFDPAAAADAGVAEGPAFGRLSAGESVEVDGREVAPEAVHTEETVSFPV